MKKVCRILRLLGDDLSVLPNIDRCAVHPSRLPGLPRRRPHRFGYTFGESLFFWRRFFLHDPLSTNLGRSPELSYTRHRFSSACHSCPRSAGFRRARGLQPSLAPRTETISACAARLRRTHRRGGPYEFDADDRAVPESQARGVPQGVRARPQRRAPSCSADASFPPPLLA